MRFTAAILILSALACAQEPEPVQGPYFDEKPLQSIDGTEWEAGSTASGAMSWIEGRQVTQAPYVRLPAQVVRPGELMRLSDDGPWIEYVTREEVCGPQ